MSFLSTLFQNPKLKISICIYSSYSRSAQITPFQASMVCVCRKVQIRPYNVWFLLLLSQRCVTAFYTVSLSHYSSKFSSRSYDGLWLYARPDDTKILPPISVLYIRSSSSTRILTEGLHAVLPSTAEFTWSLRMTCEHCSYLNIKFLYSFEYIYLF